MNARNARIRICFVCLGNICRSPTAEGVMRHLAKAAGVDEALHIDSAGTAAYHVGEEPDARTVSAARARGIHLRHRAQAFRADDFDRFDHVLAMDRSNLSTLQRMAPSREAKEKLALLRSWDPTAQEGAEVPDPYYGGDDGFEEVLDIAERACAGLLAHLREKYGLDR
jgi:protein-tyrosine phosphatase